MAGYIATWFGGYICGALTAFIGALVIGAAYSRKAREERRARVDKLAHDSGHVSLNYDPERPKDEMLEGVLAQIYSQQPDMPEEKAENMAEHMLNIAREEYEAATFRKQMEDWDR